MAGLLFILVKLNCSSQYRVVEIFMNNVLCMSNTKWYLQQVQFDKFVAQGSVHNNYANILELLLRLRQCCNHPFLVFRLALHHETISYFFAFHRCLV